MPRRSGDQNDRSRTSREAHIRFCEGPGVRSPRATRRSGGHRAQQLGCGVGAEGGECLGGDTRCARRRSCFAPQPPRLPHRPALPTVLAGGEHYNLGGRPGTGLACNASRPPSRNFATHANTVDRSIPSDRATYSGWAPCWICSTARIRIASSAWWSSFRPSLSRTMIFNQNDHRKSSYLRSP